MRKIFFKVIHQYVRSGRWLYWIIFTLFDYLNFLIFQEQT